MNLPHFSFKDPERKLPSRPQNSTIHAVGYIHMFAGPRILYLRKRDLAGQSDPSEKEMKAVDREGFLDVLNQTADDLLADLELESVLHSILAQVMDLFGVDRCAVLQVDEQGGFLKMLKEVGYLPEVSRGFKLAMGQGISGWVASTGMAAFVEDVSQDSRYIPGVKGARSEVAYPLKRRGAVVGVLDIESSTILNRGDFENGTFTLFAAQCASALFNASLVDCLNEQKEQLESRVRELQVLNHVGRLLGEVMPLDDVLGEILRLATETLNLKSCAVLLPDKSDRNLLRITASRGYPDDVTETVLIRKGEAVTGEVYQRGVAKLVKDTRTEKGYVPGVVGGRCEMAAPLMARGRVLGVLDAEGDDPGCFDEHAFVVFSTFASQAAVAIRNAQMLERKQTVYYQTISSLANALEARDAYTRGHSERVTLLALALGRKLGLDLEELELIRQAGLLHDIGKIGIPDGVLNKQSKLSAEERTEIENHPEFGNNILGQLNFLEEASKAILHHHERYDGTGYPAGLLGTEIPVVARIIAVADSWDAMTSDRPYRRAMKRAVAVQEIRRNAGTQFDPQVVRVFLDYLREAENISAGSA